MTYHHRRSMIGHDESPWVVGWVYELSAARTMDYEVASAQLHAFEVRWVTIIKVFILRVQHGLKEFG